MYTITYSDEPLYLRADIKGNLAAPQKRVEAWREIIARCRRDGITHLLVVQDSPGNGTPTNAFVSSAAIVDLGINGIKIAYVDIDPANHEINKFGELVAANRGAHARVFFEVKPAMEWLLEGCPGTEASASDQARHESMTPVDK